MAWVSDCPTVSRRVRGNKKGRRRGRRGIVTRKGHRTAIHEKQPNLLQPDADRHNLVTDTT